MKGGVEVNAMQCMANLIRYNEKKAPFVARF